MEYVYVVYNKNTQTNTKTIGFADQYSLNLIKVKKTLFNSITECTLGLTLATILTFLYLHFCTWQSTSILHSSLVHSWTSAASQCLLLLTCCCCCCCCWILSINSGKADQGTRKGSARSKHQWYPTEVPAKCPYYSPKLVLYTFAPRPYWAGLKQEDVLGP